MNRKIMIALLAGIILIRNAAICGHPPFIAICGHSPFIERVAKRKWASKILPWDARPVAAAEVGNRSPSGFNGRICGHPSFIQK
jgi:hypothetical protein